MPDGGALSTGRLLVARALARRGLLVSVTATIAVAVATVCTLLAWLSMSVAEAGGAFAPGVPAEEIAVEVDAGIVALVSAAPALVLLVVILAGTAAAQLARLLAAAREQEHTNARARGLSPAQAKRIDGFEAAAVALVGAVAGLVLALAVSAAAGGVDATLTTLAFWWAAPATAAVLAVVVVAVPVAVLVTGARRPGGSARRGTRTATGSVLMTVLVLVVLAAAFTAWQLRAARPMGFDPIVAVAPALVLLAGAIVVLAVFGVGAIAWARPAATGRGLAPGYPARQVARRLPVSAVAVLLIGLTVAQTVFASAYSATWTAMATDSSALRAGADLRVDLEPQAATPELVAEIAATAGVDAAAPALVTPVEIGSSGGSGDAQLIAVPAGAIDSVVTSAGGIVDRDELAAGVAPGEGTVTAEPIPLGADAVGLSITATVRSTRAGGAAGLQLVATVLDARGAAAQVRLSAVDTLPGPDTGAGPDTVTVQGDLPAGSAPWSLLAVTATLLPNFGGTDLRVGLVEVGAIGGEPLPIAGEAQLDDGSREAVVWLADGSPESPSAVRAVLAADLADLLGLSVGDSLEFRYSGSGRRGEIEVGAIVPAVPGAATTRAVFAPLEILQVSMLQRGTSILPGSSVWSNGDPDAAGALSSSLSDRPVATAAPGVTARIVGALVPGWWIATAGSVLLSLIAAVAIVQTLALARRSELGVLRALGVTRGAQARMRAAELAAVVGSTLVLGAVAGVLVSWAIVPDLVRGVTPGILPLGSGISFSWPVLASMLGVLVVGSAAIIVWATAGVHRAAGGATVGEDSR